MRFREMLLLITPFVLAGSLFSQMEQWAEIDLPTEISDIPAATTRLHVKSMDDEDYSPIFARFTNVEALWMDGGLVSSRSFKLLSALKQLRFLRVSVRDWTKAETDYLASVPALESLELYGRFDIKEKGVWKFPPTIRRLALKDVADWMTISVFRAALEPPGLEELEINLPVDWVVEGAKLIGQKKGLKKLRLQEFDVDDEATSLCLASGQIEELTLDACDTDGSFLRALPKDAKLKCLKLLYVSEFDGRNLAELAKLNRNVSLEFQSKESVKTIAQWLKPIAERVEALSIIQLSWYDAGLKLFKEMKALKRLTLDRCYGFEAYKSDADAAIPQLDELVLIGEHDGLTKGVLSGILLSQSHLHLLCINDNKVVEDEVLGKVVDQNSAMEQLDVRSCPNVSKRLIDEFAKTRPKLKITR